MVPESYVVTRVHLYTPGGDNYSVIQDSAMLGVIVYTFFVIFTLIVSVILLAALKWREEDGKGRVAVIVLGDLGRSPRMQYHALSLCREGYDVEFVGYGGTLTIFIASLDCDVTWAQVIYLICIPKARRLQG